VHVCSAFRADASRDLPLADVDIETPLAQMKSPKIAGKKRCSCRCRAGMTFAEGMVDLVPTARIAPIGLYREPQTFVAVEYFFKSPSVCTTAGDRDLAGAGNGEHGRRRGRPAERARRQRNSTGILIGVPEGVERMRGIRSDLARGVDEGLAGIGGRAGGQLGRYFPGLTSSSTMAASLPPSQRRATVMQRLQRSPRRVLGC
jgi:uracil phosphoribosyltransferase